MSDTCAETREIDAREAATREAAARLKRDRSLPAGLLPASRLLDTVFPPVSFAIYPYFPRGEVTELVGAHGIYKSTAALDACLSVATGRTWGGAAVEQGPAVFITMEDRERTIADRVLAWLESVPAGRERADAEAGLRRRFLYLGREHSQGLVLTYTKASTTGPRTTTIDAVSGLVQGATLVVLETAARLHDGPEMNEGLSVFAHAVEGIATTTDAAVSLVRHVSKAAARGQTTDSYAGRGGGALSDAARSVLVMTPDRKPSAEDDDDDRDPYAPVRLTHAKATLTARGPRIVWKPTRCEHGVYLHTVTEGEGLHEDARRLLSHMEGLDDGLTKSAIRNDRPAGLGSTRAEAAVAHLVATGRVVESTETRGKTKQRATVYRVAP